jgi:nanoRNase/pAp phosphatase (c-di-AMP/oligoRNAs hydrolase)
MLIEKLRKLPPKKRVLILPHENPDPDAIASAWGLSYLLKKKLGLTSTIAYSGLIGRAENRAFVKVLKIPLIKYDPHTLDRDQSVVLVDSQPYTGNNPLPWDVIPDGIIDHHPLRKTTKYKRWALIDDQIGANSTIITASFKRQKLFIPKKIATALFYAIRSETKDLGWEGSDLDYKNYLFLLPRVDFEALHKIMHPRLPKEYYQMIRKAINRSRIFGTTVICPLERVPYPELPAEIADFLIFRENIDLSFVMGIYQNDMYLSIRSLRRKVNSARLMHKLIRGYGTGGGHEIMAGGKIPDVSPNVTKDVEKTMTKRLLKTLSLSDVDEMKFIY